MHSGPYPRSPYGDSEVRVCPACGTEYPPAGAAEGPVAPCALDGYALVRRVDFDLAKGDIMLGRTVGGRFTVMARLGSGSMGAVYRAWQGTVGRWVALKIMRYDKVADPESKARFEREARAMSQLASPHTVTIFDFGQAEDGSVFLAMELLEGESLGARLTREGRIPIRDAVHFARGALVSLAEAHAKGIIHRDLKPDNLFLTEVPDVAGAPSREICKLLDFGIAKVVREEHAIDALETQAGTVFGTPRYMSPEQAQGRRLDPRTDIYSLGVILYQMVTGEAPFDDEDAVVVMARHIKTKPRAPSEIAPEVGIPSSLERVIVRALGKEPEDRPQSADVFIMALDAAEKAFPASLPVVPLGRGRMNSARHGDPLPTLAPSAMRRRRRWLLVLIAAALLASVVVAVVAVRVAQKRGGPASAAAPALSPQDEDVVFDFGAAPTVSAVATASATTETVSADSLPVAGPPPTGRGPRGVRTSTPAATTGSPEAPPPIKTAAPASTPTKPAPTSTGKYERFE